MNLDQVKQQCRTLTQAHLAPDLTNEDLAKMLLVLVAEIESLHQRLNIHQHTTSRPRQRGLYEA